MYLLGTSDSDSTGDTDSSLSDSDSNAPLESRNSSSDIDTGSSNSDAPVEPTVETADALMGRLKDLTDNATSENVYVEIPKVNLDSVIVTNEEVHKITDKCYNAEYESTFVPREVDNIPEGLEYLYPTNCFSYS